MTSQQIQDNRRPPFWRRFFSTGRAKKVSPKEFC